MCKPSRGTALGKCVVDVTSNVLLADKKRCWYSSRWTSKSEIWGMSSQQLTAQAWLVTFPHLWLSPAGLWLLRCPATSDSDSDSDSTTDALSPSVTVPRCCYLTQPPRAGHCLCSLLGRAPCTQVTPPPNLHKAALAPASFRGERGLEGRQRTSAKTSLSGKLKPNNFLG